MKTWYMAVCDKHKATCYVLVRDPSYSKVILGTEPEATAVYRWLMEHWGCDPLRLVHNEGERYEDFEALGYSGPKPGETP